MVNTRAAFLVIVGLAVLYILYAVLTGQTGNPFTSGGNTEAPANAVTVELASSNTKRNWLDQVVSDFNADNQRTSSRKPIRVTVSHVTSGGSMNAILDGSIQPTAWSPGDASWVAQLDETWQQRTNRSISSEACRPTIYAPLGFAMWRPMAETLGWPDTPIAWDTIVRLAADPNGWASYGRPEWGKFRFGHTHPAYANSGLLSMTGFVYGVAGKGVNLTAEDVYSPQVRAAMQSLEANTSKYGRQAPALLELMARQGVSYLHAAAVPEADVLRFNIERSDELSLPLAFIFPAEGTIWADHPYCILDNAEWVDSDQAEAARIFRDYLLAKQQQELAIDNYLRPLDNSIALHAPLSLENGTDPRVNPSTIPALPSPSADISAAVIDMFKLTKRKATVLVLFDVSGSMEGDRIRTAREATIEFLGRLDPDDEVGVMVFNDRSTFLANPQQARDVAEALSQRIAGLIADGGTNLYGATCDAIRVVANLQAEDLANNEQRLYGIILLSDGEDTTGTISENQMFISCLPANAEVDGIKIFPIAFGDGADQSVLSRMASVTAGRLFSASPESISNVYISISAEQ